MIKKGDKNSNNLETIPRVGKSIANDLRDIGIINVTDLVNKNPQMLYDDLCKKRKTKIDPCVLICIQMCGLLCGE